MKNFILCLMVFLSSPAWSLTLDEAVSLAKVRNPGILAAKQAWDSTRAAASRAYSLPDPHIGADFEGIPKGSADLTKAEMQFFSLSQTIPWPGMLLAEGSAASFRADMQKFAYFAKERDVVKKVKTVYYELAKLDQLIKIVLDNISTTRQGYRVAQSNYAAGRASQVELLKMQIELNRMENEHSNLQDERGFKALELNLLLNNVTDETVIADPLPLLGEELDRSRISNLLFEHSPMLGMEKSSLEEARAMAGAARSSYLPETMIKWRSQRVGPLPGSNDLMFEATLPLWFWARQNRSAEEADRQVASRQANLEVVKNTLRLELKEHLTLLGIFRKKILLYDKTLLPSARSMLQSSLTGYQAGQIDFLMLLDSIRSFRDISQSYFEALADYHIKLAELEEIVGQEIK